MKTHLWYKTIRCPTAAAMQMDFLGGLSDASRGMYAGYVEEKEYLELRSASRKG